MFREVDARGQPYSRGRLARETGIYFQYAHTFWSLDHFQIHQPVQPQHFSKIKQCGLHLSHEGRCRAGGRNHAPAIEGFVHEQVRHLKDSVVSGCSTYLQ